MTVHARTEGKKRTLPLNTGSLGEPGYQRLFKAKMVVEIPEYHQWSSWLAWAHLGGSQGDGNSIVIILTRTTTTTMPLESRSAPRDFSHKARYDTTVPLGCSLALRPCCTPSSAPRSSSFLARAENSGVPKVDTEHVIRSRNYLIVILPKCVRCLLNQQQQKQTAYRTDHGRGVQLFTVAVTLPRALCACVHFNELAYAVFDSGLVGWQSEPCEISPRP